MTDYYIRITNEPPVDGDEALWFKLALDTSDDEDNFYVIKQNEYNKLRTKFETAMSNLAESEDFQGVVTEVIQNGDYTPTLSTYATYIQKGDKSNAYSYNDIELALNSLDLKVGWNDVEGEWNANSLKPVQSKLIKSKLDEIITSLDTKASKTDVNSISNSLKNKSDSTHTHTSWEHMQSGVLNLWVNKSLRLAFCKFVHSNYNFKKSATQYKMSTKINESTFRPKANVIGACFNYNMGAVIKTDGTVSAWYGGTGERDVSFTAMWFY